MPVHNALAQVTCIRWYRFVDGCVGLVPRTISAAHSR